MVARCLCYRRVVSSENVHRGADLVPVAQVERDVPSGRVIVHWAERVAKLIRIWLGCCLIRGDGGGVDNHVLGGGKYQLIWDECEEGERFSLERLQLSEVWGVLQPARIERVVFVQRNEILHLQLKMRVVEHKQLGELLFFQIILELFAILEGSGLCYRVWNGSMSWEKIKKERTTDYEQNKYNMWGNICAMRWNLHLGSGIYLILLLPNLHVCLLYWILVVPFIKTPTVQQAKSGQLTSNLLFKKSHFLGKQA